MRYEILVSPGINSVDVWRKQDVVLGDENEWGGGVGCTPAENLSIVLGLFRAPFDAILRVIEGELAGREMGALTGKERKPWRGSLGDA